jgi:hypothetical protein
MTFTVSFPNMVGSPSLTALTLAAGETALAIGNTKLGAIAQVSGTNAGFNLFTPTLNLSYYLVIAGKNVADGSPPTVAFEDVIVFNAAAGWAPVVLSSSSVVGAPGARTYTNSTGSLHIATAGGAVTWRVDIDVTRFAS